MQFWCPLRNCFVTYYNYKAYAKNTHLQPIRVLKFLSPLFSIFHGFFSNRNDLNPDNFPKKELSSRAKFILPVGEQNAGKRLHLVARWVNTSKPKQEGPWTDALSVTIS